MLEQETRLIAFCAGNFYACALSIGSLCQEFIALTTLHEASEDIMSTSLDVSVSSSLLSLMERTSLQLMEFQSDGRTISEEIKIAISKLVQDKFPGKGARQVLKLVIATIHEEVLPQLWLVSPQWDSHTEVIATLDQWAKLASIVDTYRTLVCELSSRIVAAGGLQRLEDSLLVVNMPRNFNRLLSSCACKAPENFEHTVYSFCQKHLDSLIYFHENGGDNGSNDSVSSTLNIILFASESFRKIGFHNILQEQARKSVESHIKSYLNGKLEDCLTEDVVPTAVDRIKTGYSIFMHQILEGASTDSSNKAGDLHNWCQDLMDFVYDYVGNLRTVSLFDLVIDFPESLPALRDLRECLRHTGKHRHLAITFGNAIRNRLLHPGAATTDIIEHYVSTIRALQHVDPSGAVLHAVSAPLREYLRTRRDAIRCIVMMLTEADDNAVTGTSASLMEVDDESAKQPGYDENRDLWGANADEQALHEILDDHWEPGPLEVAPLQMSQLEESASSDVIGMLVNIYGTKELFVNEYRSMLAERLLAKTDFDCDKELRTLELLKLRFGESSLHAAEVMLKDLSDSKRINANVRTVSNTSTPLKHCGQLVPIDTLSVSIMSQLFWPQLQSEEFVLPPHIKDMLDTFAHKYHALKAPRVLQWKPSLGLVDLSLTIGDQTVDFTVSPVLATMLMHFEKQSEWSLDALARSIGLAADLVRKRMMYWINQGVIGELKDSHGFIKFVRYEEIRRHHGAMNDATDGGCHEMDDLKDDMDTMSSFEPFVIGMLTNFDSLSLDRIHNMLKMFVTDPPYDKSIEDLSAFMSRLSTEDKVILEGGLYKRRSH